MRAIDLFLAFSHLTIIIPILLMSLILWDRTTTYHAIALLVASIILNFSLKITFQIPLSPTLGKVGFAFPSGHMQLSTVFYTWLAYRFNNKFVRLLAMIILGGIGWSLIQAGYHNIYDVIAGLSVGFLLVIFYNFALTKWPQKISWLLFIIATLLIIYIFFRQKLIPEYVLVAYLLIFLDRIATIFIEAYKVMTVKKCLQKE